jgi:hypothetical protein
MADWISPEAMTSPNEDKGPLVLGSILAAVVLATLFVVARLYARGFLLKRFFLDDYFVCFGLVSVQPHLPIIPCWANIDFAAPKPSNSKLTGA